MNTVKPGRTEDEEDPAGNKNKKNPSRYAGAHGGINASASGYCFQVYFTV